MNTTTGAVGASRPRLEGQDKVTGRARYAADVPVPGLLFGAPVLSTVSHGRIPRSTRRRPGPCPA
ncbi:hypothetical protein [Nonomuraea sp. NPDC003804]|uniref:hypothetical protein n=1 Tax=Nonomuraea sp. NPDC003804 TaxID=3154547 RepID=UPI0033A73448